MTKLHTIIITFAALLISACNSSSDIDEFVGENEALCLETTAMSDAESSAAKTMTRAHWDDKNSNKFVWDDSSNEMAIFVKESPTGNLVPWGANKYTMAKVAKLADYYGESTASIISNSGMLKADIQKLVVGQSPVYFFSPITDDKGSSASESGVTLALPSEFKQPSSHSLVDFKKYTYIMAESTISQVNNARIEAKPAVFKGIPAVIRFSVTNDRGSEVKIKSIEVTKVTPKTPDGFPQNMTWNHSSPETLSPSDEKYTSLTASMGDGDPLGVKKSQNYYVFLFPTSFTSATLTITASVNGSEFTYKCEVPAMTFESNKIYTWKLTIGDQSLKLGFHENEDDLIQW